MERAFEMIRARARARCHRLHPGDVAVAVLHRPTAVPELTTPHAPPLG